MEETLQILATSPNISLLSSVSGASPPASPRWTQQPTTLRPLPNAEAQRLFLELCPGVTADDTHLALFLEALGGVPLAVQLVAQRAAGESSLRELWEDWQRHGIELATDPDLPPDHRTSLGRSLDLSWRSSRLRDEGRNSFVS